MMNKKMLNGCIIKKIRNRNIDKMKCTQFTHLMILSFFLIISCGVVTAVENPTISVDPQIITLQGADEEFTVDITIDPGSYEVYNFQYNLYYNSSVLEVVSQTEGTLLNGDGTTTHVTRNNIDEPGRIEYVLSRLNVMTGVTEGGVGAVLKFRSKVDDATAYLDLNEIIRIGYIDNSHAGGPSIETLIPDMVDGTVIIGETSNDSTSNSSIDLSIIRALDYLKMQQTDNGNIGDTEWVIMAIAAAGEDPHDWKKYASSDSIVDYLKTQGDNLGLTTDIEKYILAIVAAGENPSAFDGHNYLADLKNEFDGTQMGDNTLLNDDFWGVIALISAGVSPNDNIIQKTISYIKLNQQTDGSWSCYPSADGDTDDTAAAIMASALYELCRYSENGAYYKEKADKIMESLGTTYASAPGENYGFILGHSVGAKPVESEVDVPLNYADYYYLEALLRQKNLSSH